MKFLCPNCKAKYKIADEKLTGRNKAKMRCRKCSHLIKISTTPSGQFTVQSTPDRPSAPSSGERAPSASGSDSPDPGPVSSGRPAPRRPTPSPGVPRAVPRSRPRNPGPSPAPASRASTGAARSPAGSGSGSAGAAAATSAVAVGVEQPLTPPPKSQPAPQPAEAPGALADMFQESLTEPAAKQAPPPPADTHEWFVGIDDAPVGPLTPAQVRERMTSGQVTPDTLAWRDGFEDWQVVSSFPELAALLQEVQSLAQTPPQEAVSPRVEVVQPAPAASTADVDEDFDVVRKQSKHAVWQWVAAAVAVPFFITIGFVLGGENVKEVIKIVEVPRSAEPAAAASPEAAESESQTTTPTQGDEAETAAQQQAGGKVAHGSQSAGKTTATKPEAKPSALFKGLPGLPQNTPGPAGGSSDTAGRGSSGQLTSDQVQRTVRRYSNSVRRACWQPALNARAHDAPSSARVVVSMTVAPNGQVQGASAGGDPKGYRGLSRCIASKVRSWRFPRAATSTTVRVPFVFAAQ